MEVKIKIAILAKCIKNLNFNFVYVVHWNFTVLLQLCYTPPY